MSTQTTEGHGQIRSTWAVSLLTMASRVLGFARLVLLVQVFSSVRWASDAFIFAFRIPNLFRNLLGEGALSAAFIPVFVRTRQNKGDADAAALGSQALTVLAVVCGALTAAGMGVCLVLDWALGAGQELSLALRLTALLFPFMPLVCCAALLAGMLNSLRRFALPAALSIILNLGFLAGFAYIYWWQCGGSLENVVAEPAAYALAVFVLAAGAMEVLLELPALRAAGMPVGLARAWTHPGLRDALKAFVPVAIGLGLVQVNAFIDSLIAGSLSLASPGAVTYLEVGFRFMQLPLGVFGVAVATVSFPAFASSAAGGDYLLLGQRMVRALRMSVFLILPCSAVLIAMADPIIRLTCQRSDLAFDHAAVYRASAVLILYSAGLLFYSYRQILVRVFYALGDYSFPLRLSAVMVAVNLVLNLTLIHCPDLYRMWSDAYARAWNLAPADFPFGMRLGEAGLALATMLTALIDTAVLSFTLWRRLSARLSPVQRDPLVRSLAVTVGRMLVVSAGLGVLTWFFRCSIPYAPGLWSLLERVAVPCVLAGGAFYIISSVLPVPETNEFLLTMLRRGKK